MKLKHLFLCGLASTVVSTSYAQVTENSQINEKVGYSFGYVMGRNSAESLKDIDLNAFIQGFQSAISGQDAVFSDTEMATILTQYKKHTEAKVLLEHKALAEKNLVLGSEFLAQNARKPNIKTTKTGLQYEVLRAGKGKLPKASSTVKVHYEGRLIDGTVFDSSFAREQPVEFELTYTIQGWVEGLQLMQEGAKYRFYLPAQLAYGALGSGDSVEPNSALIFDIELLEVSKR